MRAGGAKAGVWAGVLTVLLAVAAAQAEERLVLEPYPGAAWHEVINQANGPRFIRQQVPADQTLQNFNDSLTAQSFPGQQGAAADVIGVIFNQFSQVCDMVETVGPKVSAEQGREVAYGRVYCGRQKGQTFGIHFFFKAINGSDGLYLVGRGFRTPASDHAGAPPLAEDKAIAFLQAEGVATKYLTDQVYVCDPVFPDPKCAAEALSTGR